MFESNKTLAGSASIPLENAIKKALAVVPGKAVEAEIGKDDGRTCYVVEIIDCDENTQKVYVDPQTGQTGR